MKMKHSYRRLLSATLCVTLGVPPTALAPISLARAEDIDLFVSAAATAATNPNILIVLDNSANWNSNAQHWPTPSGESGTYKQGESELRAIQAVLSELDGNNPRVNLGLMVHRSGAPDGGIVRFGIRPMDNTNKNAFIELIGPRTGCSAGTNSLNGTPNCMLQNFSGTGAEQTNNSNYGGALFDAYKYFGGWTAPAYATLDNASQVAVPVGPVNFGKARHFDAGGSPVAYMDRQSYTADFKNYVSPIISPCAKNYVIFIGNGFPGQENTTDEAAITLRNVNLGTTPQLPAQLSQPDSTTITNPVTDNLGTHAPCSTRAACASAAAAAAPGLYDTYSCTGGTQNDFSTLGTSSVCQTNAACVTTATATFPGFTTYQCTGGSSNQSVVNPACTGTNAASCNAAGASLLPGYATYTCSGGTNCAGGRSGQTVTGNCAAGTVKNQTMQGIVGAACAGSNFQNQTMQGTKTVTFLTPLPTFSAPSKPNYADEWAKFLYSTDVNELPGQQNVTTFTIDVYKDAPDVNETALLFNMAKFGGGRYFQASSEQAIISALRQIMIEIQSVNSVFASASLPINATNRSQNENQVFIGMFRPDSAAKPRWYGNLKRYQIGQFGNEFKLADASSPAIEAVSSTTGFVLPCAKSFWTVDSGDYWLFQNGSAGSCTSSGTSIFSDSPDGPQVEKGAVAEVLRRGNNPPSAAGPLTASPSRTLFTCMNSTTCCTAPAACGGAPATELVTFNRTNVSKAQLGNASMSDLERDNIVNFTIGQDLFDDNTNSQATEVRPSIHGDVAHSRPLPVNYGGTDGVVLYYGANDGTFRAVRGNDGKELWAFLAPEHHSMLKRLTDNTPPILYPNQVSSLKIPDGDGTLFAVGDILTGDVSGAKAEVSVIVSSGDPDTLVITNITGNFEFGEIVSVGGVPQTKIVEQPVLPTKKDYFFDGSAGLFQNKDNSSVWIFPSMRRGGRMIYGLDVTTPATPKMKWKAGCSNADLADTASCTTGFTQMGQTWSLPNVGLIKGYSDTKPVIIVGGGYDTCDDQDEAPNTQCTSPKGNAVFVIDADTGGLIKSFATTGSVVGDVTLLDRNFDSLVDQAYVADTKGGIYRIDFVDPSNPGTARAKDQWTMTEIARTTGANRKFLFGPAALGGNAKVYLALTSGDRERPLISNYPYDKVKGGPVTNRAYQVIDKFERTTDPATGTVSGPAVLNLDDASFMQDFTSATDCATASPEANSKRGWFFDLNAGQGEQGVTSSTIFGGLIFFSTNRPLPTPPGACANSLGEARGYAVNLLNASGVVGFRDALCGGQRSGVFVGGGLPPSPVTGTVPVNAKPVTIMIGGIERLTGIGSPIEGQQVKPTVTQRRNRIYWYSHGDR
jgi:type IV pilus assembly protein PilY1